MYKQPKPILYFFCFFVFVKRDARILSLDIEITNIIKVKTSHGSKKSSWRPDANLNIERGTFDFNSNESLLHFQPHGPANR